MKAFILAAGEGTRMRPLTNTVPKPLLEVGGKPLIQYHIERLRDAGITDLVINAYWLSEVLISRLGDGKQLGVSIQWSVEPAKLETGGGLQYALPYLHDAPFLLVSGDVWTDYPFERLRHVKIAQNLAHLVMVENPRHHPRGDFALKHQQIVTPSEDDITYTYSGMAWIHPDLIHLAPKETICFPLRLLLQSALQRNQLGGECYWGRWEDVGTPQRLEAINQELGYTANWKSTNR